ncbi:hypothetical protein PO124_23185 [Bacillus licheniformis]|nr:hypothetical protein [Bacillus licheniformis]
MANWFGLSKEDISPYLKFMKRRAVEHLFRVSCGLDSMVIGETQILGQVRTSFKLAQEEKTIGTVSTICLSRRSRSQSAAMPKRTLLQMLYPSAMPPSSLPGNLRRPFR